MDLARRYYFPIIGYNYRLTNIAAALLCAQLERAQEIISRRQAVFDFYRKTAGRNSGFELPASSGLGAALSLALLRNDRSGVRHDPRSPDGPAECGWN